MLLDGMDYQVGGGKGELCVLIDALDACVGF